MIDFAAISGVKVGFDVKLPWKKPKEATAAELRSDLDRAQAEVALEEAAERAAWRTFRESGGDAGASKAHDLAKAAADDARKQVARLLEEIPALEARELETSRTKLRARRDELSAQLT